MSANLKSFLLQRLIFPTIIAACILIRPVLMSASYLALFFWLPYVPLPTTKQLSRHTFAFLLVAIIASGCNCLLHIVANVVMSDILMSARCDLTEYVMLHVGVIRVSAFQYIELLWFAPDALMLLTSILMFVLLRSRSRQQKSDFPSVPKPRPAQQSGTIQLLLSSPLLAVLALLASAAIQPSLPGAFYFAVFLGCATWWSLNCPFGPAFVWICRICSVYYGLNILLLLAYQTQFAQSQYPANSLLVRLLGLDDYLHVGCIAAPATNLRMSYNLQLTVVSWLNPIALMAGQFVVVLVGRAFARRLAAAGSDERGSSGRKPRRHGRPATPRADSPAPPPATTPPPAVGYVAQFLGAVWHCVEWLLNHCGILSNIVLMIWSIVYHGWLTFVLLLWANVLWVLPNQRKHMMLSSPFIVAYAEVLLCLQYAYGLDFANEELPAGWRQVVANGQLGLIRTAEYPVRSIALMVLFAAVFWMTLRRHRQELVRAGGNVAAATDVLSMWTISLGSLARRWLLQLWIWLVLGFLLAIAIYGETITAIQIVYMALFLGCLITYQLSTRVWISVMYTFWLVVIGYSMFTLFLYYTYQFNGCDVLWTELFGLTISMQHDIGLDVFATKDLFLHLLYPTVVVIMAVAQIQIFHGKYVALMSFDYNDSKSFKELLNNESAAVESDERIEEAIRTSIESKTERLTVRFIRLSHFTHINLPMVKEKIAQMYAQLKSLLDVGLLLIEKHLVKVLCMYAFHIALCDVCVLHLGIAVLAVMAAVCRTAVQIKLCSLISISIGVLLIVRMSYQFETVEESWGHSNCSGSQDELNAFNRIDNNIHWFGMIKATKSHTFKSIISPYMVFLMLVTFFKFVRIQQQRKRFEKGLPIAIPKLIFADINRDRADKGLNYMLKYLVNYFHYKFGIEISFVACVVLIGYRMNLIALSYSIWLVALFVSGERFRRAVWPYFQSTIFVLIVMQYAIAVGLPPFLCLNHQPVAEPLWRAFHFWAWLPDPNLDRLAPELMFDYLLLFAVSRQQRVFQQEAHYTRLSREYPGGSNRSVIEQIDQMHPMPAYQAHDFVTFVITWLDIAKSVLFIGFYWLSLATVFLAGTNRVNIFSIGYLCGSFIFLWQGTDFYLRPIHTIIRCWRYLIGYNLFVIFTKVVMQVPNCIFAPHMAELCWLVQLIGISCKQSWFAIAGGATGVQNFCFRAQETVSLTWDEICFVVLLVQLRIFSSYYFCHVIGEIKAVATLSNRGAQLIESLRMVEVGVRAQHDSDVITKIQRKMTLIKEKQPDRREPLSHFEALYSGDYALFDESMGNRVTDQGSSSHSSSASNGMHDKATNTDATSAETVAPAAIAKDPVVIAFFKGLLLCITLRLYMLSRHYRYVMRILYKDKKRLKTEEGFEHSRSVWSQTEVPSEQTTVPDEFYMRKHSIPFEFVISLWYTIFANTEMLCYLCVFFDMLVSSSLLTMPLPLMVLLWGTLSVDRPSRTFWVTMIAYLQVVLLVKCVCQLDMAWWNRYQIPATEPMSAAVIIGIEKKDKYAAYDLLVLLAVFFHRFVLKQMGVWQSLRDEQRIAGWYLAVPDAVGRDLRAFQLAADRRMQLHSEERMLMRAAPRSSDPALDSGSEDSIGANPEETYRLLDVKLQDVSTHGVQVVVAQQDDLKLTLTKCSINDERPGNAQLVHISNYLLDTGLYFPSVARLSCIKYVSSFVRFLSKFQHQANQVPVDVYLYIFVCDFINFFVILFGSESFSYNEGRGSGIAYYVQHNQVPIAYLSTLLMQFVCIIIDRALYLRKNIIGKLVFHVLSVILVHIWLFLVVPKFTKQAFSSQTAPIVFYIIKCVYFMLSAHQIRCGYPRRLMGNRMTNSYSLISLALFKIYMLVPFLFELRTLMDWMWTETSMSLPQWLKMEDIFANTFWIKCMRQWDKNFPDKRGVSKKKYVKYLMGGAVLLGIVVIVWGPLTLFAFETSGGSRTLPTNVRMELQIGAYEPLYSADAKKIQVMPEYRFNNVLAQLNPYAQSTADLQSFGEDGIAEVTFVQSAQGPWLITPKGIAALLSDLESHDPPPIVMTINIFRESSHASMLSSMQLSRKFSLETNAPQKAALIQMIRAAADGPTDPSAAPIALSRFLPKLLHVRSKDADLFWRLYNGHASEFFPDRDLYVRLSSVETQNYWQFFEVCRKSAEEPPPLFACAERGMSLTMFSDRARMSQLLGNMSIIGIYTTFCLLVARLFRRLFLGNVFRIIYTDMPQVDAVLQLCFDIYLVRTSGDFALEEDLYAKLLFLHRSPETLIEITRLANRPAKLERWDIDLMESSEDRKIRDMRERLAGAMPMFNRST